MLWAMSRLSLYVDPKGRCIPHTTGFSFLAGFMPVIWALQRRLYGVALASAFYGTGIAWGFSLMGDTTAAAAYVVQFLLLGGLANRLHFTLMKRRGWLMTETESAG